MFARFVSTIAVWLAALVVQWPATVFAMGEALRVENLRLGAYEGDVGALEWIAKDKGFFDKVGLNVDIRGYVSGKAATDAMMAGQVDVTTASEFVFVSLSLTDPQLRILGSISHYRNKAVLARRDRGIATPTDLRGKRVGVTMPSGAEYSLHVFLALQGMTMSDIKPVALAPQALVEALDRGGIDAAITWQPHVQEIEKKLGAQGVIFPGDSYDIFLLLLTRQDYAQRQDGALRKLFAGLALAEEWVRMHPDEARRYIATRFKLDTAYVAMLWPQMRLTVDFPQELMTALDGEAGWLLRREGKPASLLPNYADFIHPAPLKRVRPQAVTVFSR